MADQYDRAQRSTARMMEEAHMHADTGAAGLLPNDPLVTLATALNGGLNDG
ncbi:MAG: hypothetical protein AAF384_00715 [Pseudomonadota bacterium]